MRLTIWTFFSQLPALFRKDWVPTIPNKLTAIRLFACPAIVLWFVFQELVARPHAMGRGWWLMSSEMAVGLEWAMVIAYTTICFTDWFDGRIALAFPNQGSAWGVVWDPVADKVWVGTVALLVVFGGPVFSWDLEYFWWIVLLEVLFITTIIARELLVAYWRKISTVEIPVKYCGKVKTTAQMIAFGFLLARGGPISMQFVSAEAFGWIGTMGLAVATALTVISLYQYAKDSAVGKEFLARYPILNFGF